MTLVLRAARNPAELVGPVRDAVRALDPTLPVHGVSSLEDVVTNAPAVFLRRYPLVLIGAFAGSALLLVAVGVVIAYAVALRRRETGSRTALGATPSVILRLVLGHGMGLAAGFALALAFARFLGTLQYAIGVADPATFAAVTVVLGVAALAASLMPAG